MRRRYNPVVGAGNASTLTRLTATVDADGFFSTLSPLYRACRLKKN
jgi:hypothetical protein